MDRKDKIEKTKENLKVDKLDDSIRKQLFNKFVESGGKVAIERQKQTGAITSRGLGNQQQNKNLPKKSVNTRMSPVSYTQNTNKRTASLPQGRPTDESAIKKAFNKFILRLKLKSLGITEFSAYYYNPSFFNRINKSIKPDLMELQILFFEIFKKNPGTGKRIILRLDTMKPSYYELVEMTGNLFDKMLFDQIVEHFLNFPDVPQKVHEIKTQILKLYKRIYVLYQFENTIYDAFHHSIDLYNAIEGKKAESLSMNKRKVYNTLFVLFHKFLPQLHLLFCHYQGFGIDILDPEIESLLEITDQDKPGKRLILQLEDDLSLLSNEPEEGQTTGKQQKGDEIHEVALKRGWEILSKINIASLRKEYDREKVFHGVSNEDRVFMSYMFFTEFDKEYSFILTTNKIKFIQDFTNRSRTDSKSRLIDLYDIMRKSFELFREYAEELAQYEKIKKEKPLSNTQYIEFTKRIESQEKKKDSAGKSAITSVNGFMNTLCEELWKIIDDMNSEQKIIENPQDIIEFDVSIEGEKKINKIKIYEAIEIVYAFALAYIDRFTSDAEVGVEPPKNSEDDSSTNSKKVNTGSVPPESDQSGKNVNPEEKSVIQELDDLI